MILLFILNNSPKMQSFLAKQVTNFLAKSYDIDLSINKIYLHFPNSIVLNDVLLNDENNNALLQTNEINISISKIKLIDRQLFVNEVNIINPEINLLVDTSGISNYSFILKKFASNEEDKSNSGFRLDIFLNNFRLTDANLKYKDDRTKHTDRKFDLSNIYVSGINLAINNFKYQEDTIELNILDLNLKEKSGINIKKMSSHFKYYDSGIILKDFIFKTNNSQIASSNIELIGRDETYLSDPINKLSIKVDLDTIIFDINDISPFVPQYKYIHDKVHLSGKFNGKLSNIKIRDFYVSYGNGTKLDANISIDGLPDYDLAFIFGNISTLKTTDSDIERIVKLTSPSSPVNLPNAVKELGNISFTGNITGLLSDLVAYGQFKTGLGDLRTDLAIVTASDHSKISFNGKIKANDVDLGKIIGDTASFGFASLNSSLRGSIDTFSNFNMQIDANIEHAELLNYDYSDIKINGLVSNEVFDGELYINDPNLRVEFLGKYFFGNRYKEQEIKFSTDIWANLSNLNIANDSLNSEIKFVMSTDLTGNFDDLLSGNLILSQFSYTKNDEPIRLNMLNINSYINEFKQRYVTARSDYLDLNLYGDFELKEFINIISKMASNYVPSFVKSPKAMNISVNNNVNFDIRLKNLDNILEMFLPNLNVNDDIFVEGMFSGKDSTFNTILSIPVITYDSISIWGNEIDIYGYSDSLKLNLSIQEINSSSNFHIFKNFALDLGAKNDSTFLDITWNNHDSVLNSGEIKVHTKFALEDTLQLPKISNHIFPSEVTIHNRLWTINESTVDFSPHNLHLKIEDFLVSHKNQSIEIYGEISEDKTKLLKFSIDNVDVANANSFIKKSGYQLSGTLSGNGRAADILNNPSFRGFIAIEDLKINNEDFGLFELSANWDGTTNGLEVEGNSKYLKLKGEYAPEKDNVNLSLIADNFKLEILEPYLNEHDLSELGGFVDINIDVDGSLSNPDVGGYLKFTKAQLVYDYLKLKVLLDDKVEIKRDAILFNNFKIADDKNNSGIINGGMYHNNFKDIKFDFTVDSDGLKLLNTTQKDNSSFYGTVFADANAKIYGNIDKLNIEVVAKTEPNSIFVLPMENSYEGRSVRFITFIQPQTNLSDDDNFILKPISSKTDIMFSMDIEVTPSAEVQIVFDPKIGDIIKGYTKGDIKVEYNSEEESFNMYGNVQIEEGDYLFTLENIINKKLTIKPGGTINFAGNPTDARIDLEAIYQTRASVKELMEYTDSIESERYNRPLNIECVMKMSGKLMSPDIIFSINIPDSDEKVKAQLTSLSQDEINKQLIFLLVMNRFVASDQTPGMANIITSTGGATSFDLLSNQISNWLSQISKDFDIGFKYYPGSEVSGQELELALSTQILNDRVLINGNFAYGEDNKANESMLGGDIEVQFKVNKSGSFRIKAFSRANRDLETEYGPYTSGAGIFYTKDFDTFSEIFTNLWNKVTLKNLREKRKVKNQKIIEN